MEPAPSYEPHLTAYIDLLGFSEASKDTNEAKRKQVLGLLSMLSRLQRNHRIEASPTESGMQGFIEPAITTFSDSIAISYPLRPVRSAFKSPDNKSAARALLVLFSDILAEIAASALEIGYLLRGAVGMGNLHHSGGVIFGEALVEVVDLEKRLANYPRVVLSPQLAYGPDSIEFENSFVIRDCDGVRHVDYFARMFTGRLKTDAADRWLLNAVEIVTENLRKLEKEGKALELSRWTWFARHFRSGSKRLEPRALGKFGDSLDVIPESW